MELERVSERLHEDSERKSEQQLGHEVAAEQHREASWGPQTSQHGEGPTPRLRTAPSTNLRSRATRMTTTTMARITPTIQAIRIAFASISFFVEVRLGRRSTSRR